MKNVDQGIHGVSSVDQLEDRGRKPYETPTVTVWGGFEDLTMGTGGGEFETGPTNTSKNV